ncbi:PadR family transcriptional regulator [Rugamonas sp. CCM 8940]|uniref:PadR family transcriptional regulator n=1 Tax=Rugamonas sp. CCM 8940 TaxID=2765359 RepID=UPI0018F2AEC1|nr:PadR family transcriptional regulator [Rugamonas sp. CCM 8940]MBJ7312229.1 PadR family transcriptional regulator [Rugamonas sp. CCM 8940]
MSLSHALLTSLLEKSSSGYDLARRFDKSIGYFWHATHQQIYRELGRMEEALWIASVTAPDAGKTRKRIYSVLPLGRAELGRWVGEASPVMDLRDELTVRLRADAVIGPLGLGVELERHILLHRDSLQRYREIEQRDFPPDRPQTRRLRINHLILQRGIAYEEHSILWAQQMLAVLDEEG